jgi:hypothetical protein
MATRNSSNNVEIPDDTLTEQGDIIYASGAGSPAALAHGTAGDGHQDATASGEVVLLTAGTATVPAAEKYTILYRGIFAVDCATLPATAVVTSATFGLYSTAKQNDIGLTAGEAALCLTKHTTATGSNTDIVNADFNVATFGLRANAYSDTDVAYAAVPTNDYFYWNLNASALAAIQAKGVVRFGVMWAFDADADADIEWVASATSSVTVNFADNVGPPANKPILTITYIIPPTVTDILTDNGQNNGSVSIADLKGTLFAAGATVKLTKGGQADINATNVSVVSATKITCDLNLTGAATGTWNVVVTNTDLEAGTLTNGFTINNPGTAVFYPDPHPEVSSVDGYAARTVVDQLFAAIRAGAGNAADSSLTYFSVALSASSINDQFIALARSIVLFDTTIIPAGATVTAATFSVTVGLKGNTLSLTDAEAGLRLVTSAPNTNTDVIAADYGTLGTAGVAADKLYSAIATGTTYNDFTVTDLTAVIKAGVTKLGLRLVIDATDGSPNWIASQAAYHYPYSSTQGGVYKPKLAVTWTMPSTRAYGMIIG